MRRMLIVPSLATVAALLVGAIPAQAAPGLGAAGSSEATATTAPALDADDAGGDAEPTASPTPTEASPTVADEQTPVPADGQAHAITSGVTADVSLDGGDDAVGVVGVSWDADALDAPETVEYRVLDADGEAGDWIELDVLAGDGPDPGTAEAAGARTGTEPLILAADEDVEIRLASGTAEVQALESTVTDADEDLAEDGSAVPLPSAPTTASRQVTGATAAAANRGLTYTSRAQWGANEKLKQCDPDTTSTNRAMVVHHTAGATNYTKAQVPGILRGILSYHTQSLGWCDIGYNMLIDRYGTVYEGRAGGVDKAIVGAHASGFNTGTFGVSIMGTYRSPAPSAAIDALGRVGAWQASLWKYDPTTKLTLTSGGGGSAKYSKGQKVSLPRIFGHRDTSATECPGAGLYGQLAQVRTKAKAGMPKAPQQDEKKDEKKDSGKKKSTTIPVPGKIGTFYKKNTAKTGKPIAQQKCNLTRGGCYQKFARGSVHWSKKSGAHFTRKGSDIARHWAKQKSERGALGYPTGEVRKLKNASGAYYQSFEGGIVVSKKSLGAHTMRGAIGAKWRALGWARSSMKLPIAAQKCTLVRGGCFQKFQGGSIHWTKKTGAHATKGAIQRAWGTQKYEKGRLGYPTSGEFTSGSLKRQNFEGGHITWSKKKGAKIHYKR